GGAFWCAVPARAAHGLGAGGHGDCNRGCAAAVLATTRTTVVPAGVAQQIGALRLDLRSVFCGGSHWFPGRCTGAQCPVALAVRWLGCTDCANPAKYFS